MGVSLGSQWVHLCLGFFRSPHHSTLIYDYHISNFSPLSTQTPLDQSVDAPIVKRSAGDMGSIENNARPLVPHVKDGTEIVLFRAVLRGGVGELALEVLSHFMDRHENPMTHAPVFYET